jgi:hypothetical protein
MNGQGVGNAGPAFRQDPTVFGDAGARDLRRCRYGGAGFDMTLRLQEAARKAYTLALAYGGLPG